ncbi:hypothetical protein B0J14DRAFT_591514 [Halenospora varia]|nr:hypothetical protein B0J14DRAFT_591514 [Halenospora varia]
MPKITKLRTLLRKDIIQNQIQHPSDTPKRKTSGIKLHELDSLIQPSESANGDNASLFPNTVHSDDLDSIFGEKILTKEEEEQAKIFKYLEVRPHELSPKGYKHSTIPAIKELREELEALISDGTGSGPREAALFRRQKAALIQEISHLEVQAESAGKGERRKVTRQTLKEDLESFPEPLTYWDRQQIEKDRARAERAAAKAAAAEQADQESAEKPKTTPKRKRQAHTPDDDLDGEERLSSGRSLKRRSLELSGRWQSSLHDYFPESADGGEAAKLYNSMTAADKLLFRRELAELGEKLALAARKKKRAESILGSSVAGYGEGFGGSSSYRSGL